jgi:hypothetical protein
MFENIKEMMTENKLSAANKRLDENSKRYRESRAKSSISVASASRPRSGSLSQRDTILIAGNEDISEKRQARIKKGEFSERYLSDSAVVKAGALVAGCGAAVVAGIALGIATPISPALASLAFASILYPASGLFNGLVMSWPRMVGTSVGLGLTAGAINLVPAIAGPLGVGIGIIGGLAIYGATTRMR